MIKIHIGKNKSNYLTNLCMKMILIENKNERSILLFQYELINES
jgi:hypothetical protein